MRSPMVGGSVAPGFEPVRAAFAENFEKRGELGAAFAVVRDGRLVVDLWGGVADETSGRPWARDTLQLIFSGTKGLVAVCLLILVDRGQLRLDAPVAEYWPAFGANGKDDVRVLDVVSHRARLPGLRALVADGEILNGAAMAARLAAQPQEPDPRAKLVYHPLTYGWLCAEILRRVDGRSIGRFFAEEVAAPLGLDLWIGLPEGEESRVSRLRYADDWGERSQWDPATLAADELLARVWNNPPLFPDHGDLPWNRREWHRAEIPGAGGIGTARSIARLYGCLAAGGELDGVRLLSRNTLEAGTRVVATGHDALTGEPLAFGLGFELQTEWRPFGPRPDAFGHGGAGGSAHCAWPSHRLGLSYAMNLMRDDQPVDPRAQALLVALHHCVG